MTLTCSRRDLHEAVQTVGRAASVQAALPILTHVLLSPRGNRLYLSATDGDLSSETSIEFRGDAIEAIAVPAKQFTEILSSLMLGDMTMEASENQRLSITQGDAHFELIGLPAADFPSIPVVHAPGDNALVMQFSEDVLRTMLRRTVFAMGEDQRRVQYTGVLFEQDATAFRLVSSDGAVRVAIAATPQETPGPKLSAIVPGRAVNELARILKTGSESPAMVAFRNDPAGPTLAAFEANNVRITTRLIEGQSVPWQRVIPASWTQRATLKSADIMGALRRMDIVARDDEHRVQVTAAQDTIALQCESMVLGKAQDRIPALTDGEDVVIALHGQYLCEGIEALGEDGCRIELSGTLSACVVRPLEGDAFIYIQSPMYLR